MARIHFKVFFSPKQLLSRIRRRYEYIKLCGKSLMYNKHVNQSYVADVCLEPLFWFVDNFAHLLGPFCIVAVACLTTTVVGIAYWIGLPYWWYKSKIMTVILLVVGNWLLINVIFHYYKAAITPAGYPPTEAFIPEAVSMCKKCIAPKPPRTHHCSICNRCILKMDHHCPWLNNCVGFGNHRYFYLYMVFTTIGCFFLVLFGLDIGISVLFYGDNLMFTSDTHLLGHPVHINKTGHLIPFETEYDENILEQEHRDLPIPSNLIENKFMFRALLFMAFICIGVILALGTLLIWHGRLITRGETSVEALINKLETKRLSALNQIYVNPYDFGPKKNWKLFLGLVKGRNFVRHVLFPSAHSPEGSGLTFPTVYEISDMA